MKSIFDLIKQEEFSKSDLKDIIVFCRIEETISPLCAVAYIASNQKLSDGDIVSLSKLLEKYPELAAKF